MSAERRVRKLRTKKFSWCNLSAQRPEGPRTSREYYRPHGLDNKTQFCCSKSWVQYHPRIPVLFKVCEYPVSECSCLRGGLRGGLSSKIKPTWAYKMWPHPGPKSSKKQPNLGQHHVAPHCTQGNNMWPPSALSITTKPNMGQQNVGPWAWPCLQKKKPRTKPRTKARTKPRTKARTKPRTKTRTKIHGAYENLGGAGV